MIDVQELFIRGKRVSIVEDHHHAVIPWARERRRRTPPLFVLTLDHHTDTLPAFTHESEVRGAPFFQSADFRSDEALSAALALLRHDEHFDFAIRTGILSEVRIFSHVNFSRDVNSAIRILHDPPESETPDVLSGYYGRALESDFLAPLIERAGGLPPDSVPFVLDLDLDYFKTRKSVEPRDSTAFDSLIRRADAISISRETIWVRLLNMDFDKQVTADFLQNSILNHIRRALGRG